jgi:5-formyltetrahydrofolate cyclo-ligase
MTKAELRKIYLEKRRQLSVAEIAKASNEIAERFFREIDLSLVRNLSTFIRIAKFGEIDTSTIYYRIWKDQAWIRTFAPRSDLATGEMANVVIYPDTPFIENQWGVREPASGDEIDPQDLDLIIVPLLAVDAAGHRVGYGKGFYDRFLSKCRPDCLKVGLNYFEPDERIVDVGEHDIKLDACVTPTEVFRF